MGSEFATDFVLRRLIAQGKKVSVPLLSGDAMHLVELSHPWSLVTQERGAPLPRQPWNDIASDAIDIVIVPGLRFGRDVSRLGQGGGHYDRFLTAHPRSLRVGLAFEAQLTATVGAAEAHDEGMDIIVTEDGPLRVGRVERSQR